MQLQCRWFKPVYNKRRFRKPFVLLLLVLVFLLALTIARRSLTLTASTKEPCAGIINKTLRYHYENSGLNVHIWYDLCPSSIQVLCDYPLFHTAPNEKTITRNLDIVRNNYNYGQRIFGYVHPPNTGKYKFAIASDDSSELWLSPNEDTSSAIMICNSGERNEDYVWTEKGNFERFPSQISTEIELQKDRRYYIEILHVQGGGYNFIQVAWYKPGASKFEIIDGKNVSLFTDETGFDSIPKTVACARTPLLNHSVKVNRIPRYLPHDVVKDVLPYCKYKPNYLNKRQKPGPVNMYSFLYDHLFPVDSYPHAKYNEVVNKWSNFGEHILQAEIAEYVANLYLTSLHQTIAGKFKVVSLANVEKKTDEQLGSRFLLEIKVSVTGETEPFMISEYVFLPKDSSALCYPEGLQWNRKARITLVITVRNQNRWMVHFLNNLQQIYAATQDQDVRLVILKYDNSEIFLKQELVKRKLPPYKVVSLRAQHYSESKSFNQGLKEVEDPHTIIFTLDLDLELPNSLFDDIRKHCFEGRSVYTPVIVNLNCGNIRGVPKGRWGSQEFSLTGIFKSDWDRVGGLDEEHYEDKWSRKHWDLMERIVGYEMEFERVRHPGIFRYYNKSHQI